MKNLLLIFLLTLSGATYAQTAKLATYNAAYVIKSTPDTTINVDTTYLGNVSALTTDFNVTFRATLQNVTGTTGGFISAQGSDDGVNWYLVHRSSTEMIVATDSITISGLTSAGTRTFSYKWQSHQFPYYRFQFISSGTQTSVMNGFADLRKKIVVVQTN